ncbi:Bug family tripartite tricarboxylate transporter substrate binding protein [Comamonas thiooxydans]|uniref:Bug family tripartite tricarboxylate transporter substrate binding protein n=1 Tax=Comamonas thiooxydans TaxID=363952 RepID=UPI0001BB181E|nr:tripartite tricarboxylate transporter substrate binding protein [Comamonas thiooxydans]ACY32669.1 TctC [Comamonas thiooxydans]MDO1476785.1 tripartite tricarboxylate transporter substrate binding protein [Comamonas thiooxydans]
MNKRSLLIAGMSSLMCALPLSAVQAADYPSKPVKIIVGYPPGGTTDLLARLVGLQLQDGLKQPVVIENKPGAGGGIGAEAVAKASPDGYTLGLGTAGNLALNYASYPKISYDSRKDFTLLSVVATMPNVLVVNSKTPVKNYAELIAYLKRKDKEGSFFASTGTGNGPHLTGELFKARTGLNLSHVPYQGAGPAITAVLGGEVDMLFDNLPSVLPFIQSGKVRAIAVTSAARIPVLPDVPTLQDVGLKDFVVDAWFALMAPAGLDKGAREKLSKAIVGLSSNEAFKESIRKLGATPKLTGDAELKALIELERDRWPALVKQSNIKF